jgi:hypothetical protein
MKPFYGRANKGLRIKSREPSKSVGDGVALKSVAHPPGAIEKLAEAIVSGKLPLKRKAESKPK